MEHPMNQPGSTGPDSISAQAKRKAVLRVKRGEPPARVALALGIPTETLMEWVRKYELASRNLAPAPDQEFREAFRSSTGVSIDAPSFAQAAYPELMAQVDPKVLAQLTPEQVKELLVLQAKAQEKVGYEPHTPKFFLPVEEDPYPEGRTQQQDMFVVREINRPLLVFGGMMLGAVAALLLAKSGFILENAAWWFIGGVAAAGTILLFLGGR